MHNDILVDFLFLIVYHNGMKLTADKIIPDHLIEQLLQVAHGQDYYMIAICVSTGLRISELVSLTWKNIFQDCLVVVGKGRKKRTVFFGDKTRSLLDKLKELNKNSSHLFIGQRGPLTRHGAHRRFKRLVEQLEHNYSMHSLRHNYATTCLNNGVPIHVVKEQVGHSSINTTATYLHFTEENKYKIAQLF